MVRKLLPVIICVIVLIVVLVGVNVIKAKWSADEAIAFNEGEGAIIAADLVESSNISNIEVGTGAAPVVKADDGRQALYMAWPMAERLMRETGRGAEADAIIREVREAYEREKG